MQENNSGRRATMAAMCLSLLTFNSTPAQSIRRDSTETIDSTKATSVEMVGTPQRSSSFKTSSLTTSRNLIPRSDNNYESSYLDTPGLIPRHLLPNGNVGVLSHKSVITTHSYIPLRFRSNIPMVLVSRINRSAVLAERTRKK